MYVLAALASRFPLQIRLPRVAFSLGFHEFEQPCWVRSAVRCWSTCGLPSSFELAETWWFGSPCGYWENCRRQRSAFDPWNRGWQCGSVGTRPSGIWFLCLNIFFMWYINVPYFYQMHMSWLGEFGKFVLVNPRLHDMGPSSSMIWGTRPAIAHMVDLTARFLYLTRPRGKRLPKSR